MLKILIKLHIFLVGCSVLMNFIAGCATSTKPNTSVIDREFKANKRIDKNANFHKLKELLFALTPYNPKLAYELGKLPEFQDNITNQELLALEEMAKVLNEYPLRFNLAFNKMNIIGLSDVRRFNSPLQALFWLFLDGYHEKAKAIVLDYTLDDLLHAAWLLKHTRHLNRWEWRTNEAKKLFNSCVDGDIRKKIILFYKNNKGATDYIIALSEQYPNSFLYKFRPFENERIKQNYRWDDLEEVVGRVNSPELIHYYIMAEYSYGIESYRDPKLTFRVKSGTPDSIARLGEYLLKKAGYKTFIKKVKILGSVCATEHTGSGIVLENGSLLLVIDFPKGKSIVGPLDKETLINVLSQGHCLYPSERFYNIPKDDGTIMIDPFANTI